MRTQGEVICDDAGNPLRMVGVCEDVTARSARARPSPTWPLIVASSNDAIYAVTRAGAIASWNPAAERMFGYRAAEALDQPVAMLLAHHGADTHDRMLAAALAGEQIEPFETSLLHSDHCLVEVSLSFSPMRSAARTRSRACPSSRATTPSASAWSVSCASSPTTTR